jgi:hypothetical protein
VIKNNLSSHDGSVSVGQKQIQKPKDPNKRAFMCLMFVVSLYLGGLGLLCVQTGGYVGVQIQDLILTFSGQPKVK